MSVESPKFILYPITHVKGGPPFLRQSICCHLSNECVSWKLKLSSSFIIDLHSWLCFYLSRPEKLLTHQLLSRADEQGGTWQASCPVDCFIMRRHKPEIFLSLSCIGYIRPRACVWLCLRCAADDWNHTAKDSWDTSKCGCRKIPW